MDLRNLADLADAVASKDAVAILAIYQWTLNRGINHDTKEITDKLGAAMSFDYEYVTEELNKLEASRASLFTTSVKSLVVDDARQALFDFGISPDVITTIAQASGRAVEYNRMISILSRIS